MTDNKKQPPRKVEDLTNMKCGISKCGCKLWQTIKGFFCSLMGGEKGDDVNKKSEQRIPPSAKIAEEKAPAKKAPAKKTTAKKTTTKKASPKSTTKGTAKKAPAKKTATKKTTTKKAADKK